jgi:hypothetical protein
VYVYRPSHGYAQHQVARPRWWFAPEAPAPSVSRSRRSVSSPYVYRQPYNYAQRHAARVEWQPQPEWAIDASIAEWSWTTYPATFTLGIPCSTAQWAWTTYLSTVTISGDVDITVNPAQWTWTGYRSTIVASVEIATNPAQWEWTGLPADVDSTLFTSETLGIGVRPLGYGIRSRAQRYSISARVN